VKLVSSQVILITFFVALAAHGAIIVNDTPQGVLTGSSQSQIFLDLDDNTVSDLTFTASVARYRCRQDFLSGETILILLSGFKV
jgi:hypothetical protein